MKIIRKSVFETNSSSTHSLTIGNDIPEDFEIPEKLEVCEMEKGRYFDYDTVDTRYTALVLMAHNCGKLDELMNMLSLIGVKERILCKSVSKSFWNSYGIEADGLAEIDSYDSEEYCKEIMQSLDTLKRYLFSPDSSLSGVDNNDSWY